MADASEGMSRLGIEAGDPGELGRVLPRLQANLAYELHRREGESTIHEHYGARVRGVDHDCPGGGRSVIESDVGVHRLVAVDPDSGRDIHQDELPARNRAIAVAFEIHGEFEVVPRARSGAQRTVTKAWHRAMHPAHRDRGDREAAVKHADSDAIPEPQRGVADVGGIRVHGELVDPRRQNQRGAEQVDREQTAAHPLHEAQRTFDHRRGDRPIEACGHRRLVGSRRVGKRRLDRVYPQRECDVPEPADRAGGTKHGIAPGDDHSSEGIKRPHRVYSRIACRRGAGERNVVALRLLRCEGSRSEDHCEYHHHAMHIASYRSANFTPWAPARPSPMIHAAVPARLAAPITASVSSRAATAIIPMPRLNTRRISPSDTSPARISTRNTGGHDHPRASTTASHPAGSTRTRLPGIPPPVMCASACRRAKTGVTAVEELVCTSSNTWATVRPGAG